MTTPPKSPEPAFYCLERGPDDIDDCPQSCFLVLGHAGPHQWTRDDHIFFALNQPDPDGPPCPT